jgi:hypothetical protein
MRYARRGRLWVPEAPNLLLDRGPGAGRSREIEIALPMPRVEGIITAELLHGRTGIVKRRLKFRNLIVDAGLNAIGAGSASVAGLVGFCGVGTGSTAPANGQTDLVTPISVRVNRTGTGNGTTGSGTSFAYWYYQRVFQFIETEANGNLAEVGFFTALTSGTMWARQLFKDGAGNPTVLTKTSADQLRITYEFRVYPPTVDVTGNVTISSTVYAYVCRASNISNALVWGATNGVLVNLGTWSSSPDAGDTNVLGTTSSQPAASSFVLPTSMTFAAYTSGTFLRDGTAVWDPGIANFAGGLGCVRAWAFSGAGAFQLGFTPKFAKDSTKRLTLVLRHTFGRYP